MDSKHASIDILQNISNLDVYLQYQPVLDDVVDRFFTFYTYLYDVVVRRHWGKTENTMTYGVRNTF